MRATVLGGSGFIGSALVKRLAAEHHDVYAPARGGLEWNRDLGHVIYAIGLTADFRTRPLETIDAHVSVLAEVLRRGRYDSLVYLSSTRVYRGATDTHEDAPLTVQPSDPDDLYRVSKLAGESLCLGSSQPAVRVVRLSNVYGFDPDSENFLPSVLREAAATGELRLHTAAACAKDYIALEDVVDLIPRIVAAGRDRLYNVASGRNVTSAEIADVLGDFGVRVSVEQGAPLVVDPVICIDRIAMEFGFKPQQLAARLPGLYREFQARFGGARAAEQRPRGRSS